MDLILPNGGRVFCGCTGSSCTPPNGSEFECTATPSQTFYSATIQYVASPQSWLLTTKDGTKYTFRYETGTGPGALLQSIADRYGNQITLTRNPVQTGPITQISSSNGRSITLTYTGAVVTQATDNANPNRTTSYHYTSGAMDTATDLDGNTTSFTWFPSDLVDLASITLNNVEGVNQETQIGYTALGSTYQFAYLTPPMSQGYYHLAYSVNGGHVMLADIYDPRTIRRHLAFNTAGYLTSEALDYPNSDAETTSYTRDPATNFVTYKTDALGRETQYAYDFSTSNKGNLLSVTRLYNTANAFTTSFFYNMYFQELATITDPLNHVTTFGYNSSGNMTLFQDAVSNTINFTYYPDGQVKTATDQASDETQFGYNSAGDLTSVIDPNNHQTTATYDGAGRLTSVTDPLRNKTTYVPDAIGNILKIINANGGTSGTTTFSYDAASNLQSVVDGNQHIVTTDQYDSRDRIKNACDAGGHCTLYQSYDADDNLMQVKSGTGHTTVYTYDNLNRRTEIDYDVGGSSPSNVKLTQYDAGDRLLTAVDSLAGTITRQYGTSGTSLASGLDFMTQEVTPQGTVNYTPDPAGRRTLMTVKIGTTAQPPVNYQYDYADKLTSVSQNGATTTKAYTDPAGRLKTVTLPNGVAVTHGYDKDSNVSSLTYGGLGTLTYGYDADDQRTSVGGSFARTNLPTTAQTFSYNPDNSLQKLGSVTVQNDNNGDITCMVSSPCPQFSYDARGHLQQAGTGVATVDFSYDALGRRNQLTTAFTNITYQYDDLNIAETWFNGLTGQASTYLGGLGLDELFSFTFLNGTTNTTDSLLRDPLNSAVAVTDSSQALQDQYTYDPYGNTSDSGGSSANPFQFTGRENDDNGLYYMRGRYYSPAIGRFISRDPAGFAGGFNLYEYAGDRPTNVTDPTGLDGFCAECGGNPNEDTGPAIPHGFVGVPSISQLAPVPNINGFDIQQGRRTNGGLLVAEEEDEEPEVVEENFALQRIFQGLNPVIPEGGIPISTVRGEFLIEPGSEVGPTRKEKGYIFNYARTPQGENITIRVMGPVVRGKANYPNGYVVFNNSRNQPVDPNTLTPVPTSQSHFAILP